MPKLTRSLEDYLEALYIIGLTHPVVRVKDVMDFFAYKVSSVNTALNILKNKRLILHEKYGSIFLTPKGFRQAKDLYEKHQSIARFFIDILGVEEKRAFDIACAMEHFIDGSAYERITRFQEYAASAPRQKAFLRGFEKYLEKQDRC